MEAVNSVENVGFLETIETLEVGPSQPKEYFHIITRKNNGRHTNTTTNSHLAIKKNRKRGRKPKVVQNEFGGESNPKVPEGVEPKTSKRIPCLMVNEREKRKKSTRFSEFLEVIKGEKDFYIDQEDVSEVKPGKKGRGRKKKEQGKQTLNPGVGEVPIHHIFSDGHLSVLAQSIDDISDTTCVIHVKEGDAQENSLLASIRNNTTLLESSFDESSKFINSIELNEELNFDLGPLSDLKKSVKPDIKIEEALFEISEYENEMESLQIFESQNGISLQPKIEKTDEYIDESFKSENNIITEQEKDSTLVHKINSYEPGRNFRCKLCSKMFLTFEDAKSHAKTFHSSTVYEATNNECNEPDYRCPECDRTFPTEKGRNKHHLLMHLKNKPVSCPDCLVCFNSFRSLERHLKSDHDRNPVNFCDICEEEFVLTASLEHHISISHPPKSKFTMDTQYARHIKRVIKCPICDKKVIGLKEFRWHHSKIHNGEPFTCKQCKYRTYSISMLKRHLATVHKALNISLYICSICKAGYQIPQDLEDHYISAHNKVAVNHCPFCGEKFACLEMLRYHKGKHRAYTCQFCPMGFMKPETLEEHLSTVHKHDLSKETETLLEEVNMGEPSTLIENEKNDENTSSTSGLLNTVNTKILEIKHDGSVEVKENLLPLTPSETQGPSRESPNRVHHLHHTKDGNLQELDLNNPLKGFRLKDLPKKINCPICNKLLTTKFLKTHMRSHEGSLPHKCPKCSKAYAQGTLLRKHMKSKHYEDFLKLGNKMPKKKKIKCEYCELVLDDIYQMEDHLWSHIDVKTYECEMCHIKFGMKVNWMEHYKTHYFKGEKPCPTCNRSFKTVGYYREHVERCQSNWTCEECGFKCENPEIYRKHKKLEHSDGSSICRCQHCNKSFYPKSSYKDHLISLSSIKQFSCNRCTKEFKRKKPLLEHISKAHIKTQHVCSYCSLSFESLSELTTHTREHKRQQMICEECGVVYLSRQTLDNHIAVYHDVLTQDPFICSICSEMFQKQIDWKLHLQKHSIEPVFVCQVNRCHKIFKKEQILRAHITRRHSYLEYFCHFCDSKFLLDSDLHKHIETHKELSSYSCNSCKFIGTNKTELNAHKTKYHEEKVYECNLCDVQFSKKDDVVSHVTVSHGQENPLESVLARRWKCSVCEKSFLLQNTFVKHLQQHTMHGVTASGILTKVPLIEQHQPLFTQEMSSTISLNWEDLLPLLKVELINQGTTDDEGKPTKLQTESWQCLSCFFIANSEEAIKNHINISYECLKKLEGILASNINSIPFETRIVDEDKEEIPAENLHDDTSTDPQFILIGNIGNNFTNDTSITSKDSVILMDNNFQFVLNTDLSEFLNSPISDSTSLPMLEIQDDKVNETENSEIIQQALPLEINSDILSEAGVLIQTDDGRLVIQEIGEGGAAAGMVQYQLVKEKTDDQGTTESTYEILEPSNIPGDQIASGEYQYI